MPHLVACQWHGWLQTSATWAPEIVFKRGHIATLRRIAGPDGGGQIEVTTAMNPSFLERRVDPRTHAFVPISLRYHGSNEETPAHLLDLSPGGAGLLTTSQNAPQIGEHLHINFEHVNTDGGTEAPARREIGVVVNLGIPERGITRVGVRFVEPRGFDCDLFDPIDTLNLHRKGRTEKDSLHRWETARHFDRVGGAVGASAW